MALRAGYTGIKKSMLGLINSLAVAKIIKNVGDGLTLTNAGTLKAAIDTATMEIKDHKLAAKGGQYTETVLATSLELSSVLTLNDDIDNYDVIRFRISYGSSDGAMSFVDVGAAYFKTNCPYVEVPGTTDGHILAQTYGGYIRIMMGDSDDKIQQYGISGSAYIDQVIGIKY